MIEQTNIVSGLSAEDAYKVGLAVGSLLQQGITSENAVAVTRTMAEFIRKGVAAQQAVDEILSRM